LSDPYIEEYFRAEIQMAWAAVVSARPNPAAYSEAFDRYSRLLFEADRYCRDGRLPSRASTAGR